MPPKRDNLPIDIVEIDSSDDEGGGGPNVVGNSKTQDVMSTPTNRQIKPHGFHGATPVDSPAPNKPPLDSRSFWKAGNIDVSSAKSVAIEGDLEHARVHPKFLHSNATSHKWAFGAIAELLDNAVDEINNGATFVKVDRIYNVKDNSPALMFLDDGGGMDPGRLRKCMSLGYSSKTNNTTIGQYGNGFKTSTMRLCADVIVFTWSSQPGKACCHLIGHKPPDVPSVHRVTTAQPQVKVADAQVQLPTAEHQPDNSLVDERSVEMISEENIQLFIRMEAGVGSERHKRRMDPITEEPLFTYCTRDFICTHDYIFYSADSLTVVSLLELLHEDSLRKNTALPSPEWSSDRIALLAEFRCKSKTKH